jgi:hypothetical protein
MFMQEQIPGLPGPLSFVVDLFAGSIGVGVAIGIEPTCSPGAPPLTTKDDGSILPAVKKTMPCLKDRTWPRRPIETKIVPVQK